MDVSKYLKPVKTKADYKRALKTIDELWSAKPNTPEGNALEVVTILVEAYEKEHYPIAPPSPIEAIRFRMEQGGLRRVDLAPFLGGRNRVTEILNGRRRLTVKMIKQLYEGLGIPPESLLGY